MHCRHPMPFGAELLEGGGARFRLWAPSAKSVALRLDRGHPGGERTVPCRFQDGGWIEAVVADATAGLRYQWLIDDQLLVPDPAARHNPQGPHAPSVLVDALAFDWSADAAWRGRPWHEAVFYELHVGTFTPEGTFAAAIAKLPALVELGVTALQLMPLADFPGRFGWGYDGVLPFAPFHGYGTPGDLKRLVCAAHALGLMVFGDVVYNHFGPDGNYLHAYAEPFFSPRHRTAWGPALNFDERGVRDFVVHNALYWLEEFRFDGLRLDAVHALLDDGPVHVLDELSHRVRAAFPGRHVHLVLENDANDERRLAAPATPGRYDGQWNGDVHHALHVLLTGERDGYYAEYDQPLAQLARALTHGFARQGDPHGGRRRAAQGRAPLGAIVNLLHNHDQIGNRAFGERLTQLVPDARALRLASAIVWLAPTVPLLFMGEEWGTRRPFQYFADWDGALRDAVREGRRREFAHFPRYAAAAAEGTLPDPCSIETLRRCRLDDSDPRGDAARAWHGFVAEVLALRHAQLVPKLPTLAADGHESALRGTLLQLRWRFDDGVLLQMQANLGGDPAPADALPPGAQPLFATGAIDGDVLGAWAGRWHWQR